MKSYGRLVGGLLVLLLGVQGSVLAQGIPADPAANQWIEERLLALASERSGLPASDLEVGNIAVRDYPLAGLRVFRTKVLVVDRPVSIDVAVDAQGNPVDVAALQAQERAWRIQTYGKLHPALFDLLQTVGPAERVDVAIWVKGSEAAPKLERGTPEEFAEWGDSLYEARQIVWEETHGAFMQDLQAPVVAAIAAAGYSVKYASPLAPILYATLPAHVVGTLAVHPSVDVIDQAGVGQPDLASAVPTTAAEWPRGKGYNGTGIKIGDVECGQIDFDNPLVTGCTDASGNVYNPSGSAVACHPTCIAGIINSSDSTDTGVATGACLYSANSDDWSDGALAAATDWASGKTQIHNHSYTTYWDQTFHNDDRHLDYLARNANDTITKSAGNRNGCDGTDAIVTSPGIGYNVLSVGNHDDAGDSDWLNDTMNTCSSYVDPTSTNGDREKPDITAPGKDFNSTNGTAVAGGCVTGTCVRPPNITDCGGGTSYSAPYVAAVAAQMMERRSTLTSWPEGIRAILMATALNNIEGASRLSDIDGPGAVDAAAAFRTADLGNYSLQWVVSSDFPMTETFTAYSGQRVKAAIAWDSNPSSDYTSDPLNADLDLRVKDPDGAYISSASGGVSNSYDNSFEVIDFTAPSTGTYTLEITKARFDGTTDPLAVAWWPGVPVLTADSEVTSSTPPDSEHEFRADTPSLGWHAVGIRMPSAANYNLYLYAESRYDNPANYDLLASSTASTDVELVVIDDNHSSEIDVYPTVKTFSGSGSYPIEYVESTATLTDGTYGYYYFSTNEVLMVWDITLTASETKYIAAHVFGSGDADLAIRLFDSDPADSTTWEQGRTESVASADASGAGGREEVSYTPTDSDQAGLVIYHTGSTTLTAFKVYVDSTAPSGTITINGGDACTNSTSVTLTLSASDADTGVYQMSFRNTIFDSWSTWEDYATTKSWTINSGDGTRSAWVRFKNYAGMISTGVSDTILLDTTAPGDVTSLTSSTHTLSSCTNDLTVTMTWTAASDGSGCGIAGYGVHWSQSVPVMPTAVQDIGAVETYTEILTAGTNWYFNVRAVDGAGNWSSTYAYWGPFTLDSIPPSTVSDLTSTTHTTFTCTDNFTVTMSWTAATDDRCGLGGYSILWSLGAPVLPDKTQEIGTVTTYTETLLPGLDYFFNIRAVDAAGNWDGDWVSWGPFSLDDIPAEVIPIDARKPNATDVRVSWTSTPNADRYRLMRAENAQFTVGVVQVGIDTTALFLDDGGALLSATSYYYEARGVNACGAQGP